MEEGTNKATIGDAKPTGVDGLDEILTDGVPSDSTILLTGASGTGKTILTLQWLAEGYRKFNEPGLYLTLTEPVNKIKRNAESLDFWDPEIMSVGKVYVEDLRTMIESLGLATKDLTIEDIDRIIDSISDLVTKCNARRVAIDSITAIAYRLEKPDLIRTFIYHLDALLTQSNISLVMTSEVIEGEGDRFSVFGVEEFISDGIIKLSREKRKLEIIRTLQVVKMRGVEYDSYPASFKISKSGLIIYPRLSRKLNYKVSSKRVGTGMEGLDKMTKGGFLEGSSILITGASGTGKTLTSLQFVVEAVREGHKALFISFEESRKQILRNAMEFGWDLKRFEEEGLLKLVTVYPEERYIEEHVDFALKDVDEFGAKFVVLDSLSALANTFSEEVLRDFVSRMIAGFKEKIVTSVFTHATSSLLGAGEITEARLSSITDQIIMLRYVEIQSELKHALLILKMRGSEHDKTLRELSFDSEGIKIADAFIGYEGVLSGSTRMISQSVEDQLHDVFIEVLGPVGETIFQEEKKKGISPESVKRLIKQMGEQGALSKRDKAEFTSKSEGVFSEEDKSGEEVSEKESKRGLGKFFSKKKNQDYENE